MPDAWPDSLSHCLPRDGQSEAMGDGLIRYQPDAGPAQVRRRSSAVPRPFTGMVILTRAQLATLRTFVDTTLLGGSLPFTIPAQSEAGTWLVRFADKGLPRWTPAGGKYRVSFELEILP